MLWLGVLALAPVNSMAAEPELNRRLSSYFILALRSAELENLQLKAPANIGVNCPAPSPESDCGHATFSDPFVADGSQIAADVVDFTRRGGQVWQVFRNGGGPLDKVDIRHPPVEPFTLPIIPDSCDASCTPAIDVIERACGFPVPFPTCDVLRPVLVLEDSDCALAADVIPGNGRCDLAPGTYGNVTVQDRATLHLQGGVEPYNTCSFVVGVKANVTMAAPSVINASGDLAINNQSTFGEIIGDVVVRLKGPGGVTFGRHLAVAARVCAPERTVHLGKEQIGVVAGKPRGLVGQFIGDRIIADRNVDPETAFPQYCESNADCTVDDVSGERRCVICPTCSVIWLPCCTVNQDNYCTTAQFSPDRCSGDGVCDDSDFCTVGETCDSRRCGNGTPRNCDDGNACTDDGCDSAGRCTRAPNTAPCDDGNACTTADTCAAETCQGTPIPCDDGRACTVDSCAPDHGCVHDTNGCPCTADAECGDGNPCTTSRCGPSGTCDNLPISDGESCDDGNACNGTATCRAGECEAGEVPVCDDGNPCTNDACEPASGCRFAAVPDETPCGDTGTCDSRATCRGGACTANQTTSCLAALACALDAELTLDGCPLLESKKIVRLIEHARTLAADAVAAAADGRLRAAKRRTAAAGRTVRRLERAARRLTAKAETSEACSAIVSRIEAVRRQAQALRGNLTQCT